MTLPIPAQTLPVREPTEHRSRVDADRDIKASTSVGALALAYLVLIVATRPLDYGDTVFYLDPILAMGRHPGMAELKGLLDFGHLLWRPLGWIGFLGAKVIAPGAASLSERALAMRVLVAISVASGAAVTILLYGVLRQVGVSRRVSIAACVMFLATNAVVNTSQSGSSYMAGLAVLTGALALAITRRPGSATRLYLLAGVLAAFAAALWLPYVLEVPAIALAAAVLANESSRSTDRAAVVRGANVLLGATLGCVVLFGGAALVLGIRTPGDLLQWVHESGHGWRQSSKLIRLGMGLPRCCFPLGDAGALWKRFLFHDPYAPVSKGALIRGSIVTLGLMAIFYIGLGLVFLRNASTQRGRKALLVLLMAAVPMLIFAVALFEPSSIERFLPLFPFLFLATGVALNSSWQTRRTRIVTVAFLSILLIATGWTYSVPSVRTYWRPAQAALLQASADVPRGSTIALLSNQDPIALLARYDPLEDTLSASYSFLVVIRPANEGVFCWRENFAQQVLRIWESSREVWLSEKLLAVRPEPAWGWVEGDDKAIRWTDVSNFFSQFSAGLGTASRRDFVRLNDNAANRAFLARLAEQPCSASPRPSPPVTAARTAALAR